MRTGLDVCHRLEFLSSFRVSVFFPPQGVFCVAVGLALRVRHRLPHALFRSSSLPIYSRCWRSKEKKSPIDRRGNLLEVRQDETRREKGGRKRLAFWRRGKIQSRLPMSVEQVSSNVYGQLDAQIAQLIQCKPLPEQEVFFRFCHPICLSLLCVCSSVLF
jgi:hypothetical protein